MQSTHSWLGVEVSQSHPHPQSQSLDNKSDETDFPRIVSVESRASYKSRTIETGNSFLEGLELPQTTYVDNSKSIYYKNEFGCDRYEQEVGTCKLLKEKRLIYILFSLQVYDNDNVTEAEAIRFTEGQAWSDMIQGVSQRIGVQVEL